MEKWFSKKIASFYLVFATVDFFRVKIVKLLSKMKPPPCAPKSETKNQEPGPMHVFTDKNEGFCMISRKSLKIEVGKRTKQQQRIVPEPLYIVLRT